VGVHEPLALDVGVWQQITDVKISGNDALITVADGAPTAPLPTAPSRCRRSGAADRQRR
jgi:hypothetical protein